MSKILEFRVINCMTIQDAIFRFDDRGIVVIKGYNDSGKTAVMTCLDVLLYNKHKRKQVAFITKGARYMRGMLTFDDGVIILRDKYDTGASLYEMYKDGQLVFSTKENNMLTDIQEVPTIIADYLGVVKCGNLYLNSRRAKDPLFLVDTSGADNYLAFSDITHSEELSLASRLLNTDKNTKKNELDTKAVKLNLYKEEYTKLFGITDELVAKVDKADISLTNLETKTDEISNIYNKNRDILMSEDVMQISPIDTTLVSLLGNLIVLKEELEKEVIPNCPSLEIAELKELATILLLEEELNKIEVPPPCTEIVYTQLDSLDKILVTLTEMEKSNKQYLEYQEVIKGYETELNEIEKDLQQRGIKTTRCTNCNTLVAVDVNK